MKSVVSCENLLVIKNSKFITLIYPLQKKEDIDQYLEQAKEKYPNATHYCYAYIFDQIRKESDDGEPAGTAGIPILQVLEKNELNHVLCIVVRYFGKIKLGAGGLVRAYTKSATLCLKDHIVFLDKGLEVTITFPYSLEKEIDYLLKQEVIISKKYSMMIEYQVYLHRDCLENLQHHSGVTIQIHQDIYF